ncbi:hypothetical protein C8Q75DRAFT_810653 [Abortiporus biennis]|nr:hypothetical protein C8Q75DRAFT_810653 [Abortiporus biennis]
MHRSYQCLARAAVGASSAATRSVAAASQATRSRPLLSTSATERDIFQPSPEALLKVDAIARDLLFAAAKSNEPNPLSAKSIQNGPRLPSNEQVKFFAEEETFDDHVEGVRAIHEEFERGTFLEIRRNQVSIHAVALRTEYAGGTNRIRALLSNGEVWLHLPSDVTFAVPNFIDRATMNLCGFDIVTQDENQISARIQVLKKLREFTQQVEDRYIETSILMADAYERLLPPDPQAWSETTPIEVSKRIFNQETPPLLTLFAIHKHLMRKGEQFVASHVNFISTSSFFLRPKSHYEILQKVKGWINRRDPRIDHFIATAQKAMTEVKSNAVISGDLSTEHMPIDVQFSEDDAAIIRFLLHSIRTVRSFQYDPYTVPISTLAKRLRLTDGRINDEVVHKFLIDIGALPPWDDPVIRGYISTHATSPLYTERNLPHVSRTVSRPLRTLGPEDYYTEDIAADVRHDFGDLPVYVIDDFGAEELDDGVSVEKIPSEPGSYWVHSHVADPTAVLPPTHSQAQYAHRQGSTIYYLQHTMPMLPHLPADVGLGSSAETGQAEKTITFSFKVDSTGDITDYTVRAGLVRKVHVLKYDDVDIRLGFPKLENIYPFGGKPSYPTNPNSITNAAVEDLRLLDQIADRLLRRRLQLDVFNTTVNQARVSIRQKPFPRASPIEEPRAYSGFPEMTYSVTPTYFTDTGARRIVAELMKASCKIASLWFRDNGIPALRRSVGQPIVSSPAIIDQMMALRDPNGTIDYMQLLKNNVVLPAGDYTTKPAGHAQLGIRDGEGYCKVTSPLRRYGDLLMHWQIKHALSSPKSKPMFSEEFLTAFAAEYALTDSKLSKQMKRHEGYWTMKFLSRWLQNPELREKARFEDPMQNLTALRIGDVRDDMLNLTRSIGMIVPSLGVKATLVGLDKHEYLEIGEPIKVEVDSIRLGLTPAMYLKKA